MACLGHEQGGRDAASLAFQVAGDLFPQRRMSQCWRLTAVSAVTGISVPNAWIREP